MTFLELCKEVRRESGQSGDGPSTVVNQVGIQSKIVNWVKRAYRSIVDEHTDWSFLWSRTASTIVETKTEYLKAELGIPDARLIERVKIGTLPLKEIEFSVYRKGLEDSTDVGAPRSFTVLPNGSIAFVPAPTPGTQIKFDYYRVAPSLSQDLDVPLMPSEYHDAVTWLAVVYCATDQENGALAGRANAILQDIMDSLNRDCRPKGPYT